MVVNNEEKFSKKSILKYFGVKSQHELVQFMKENPEDARVIELKELLAHLK